jgi:hypothetical protein
MGTVTALSLRNPCITYVSTHTRPPLARGGGGSHFKRPPRRHGAEDTEARLAQRPRQRHGAGQVRVAEGGTYLRQSALGQLVVPAVLDLDDLAVGPQVDAHHALHRLLSAQALERVAVGQLQLDWVAGRRDCVRLDDDGVEERGEAVPLGGELVKTRRCGDWVLERGVLSPQGEVLEGWFAVEELAALVDDFRLTRV